MEWATFVFLYKENTFNPIFLLKNLMSLSLDLSPLWSQSSTPNQSIVCILNVFRPEYGCTTFIHYYETFHWKKDFSSVSPRYFAEAFSSLNRNHWEYHLCEHFSVSSEFYIEKGFKSATYLVYNIKNGAVQTN